MAHFDSSFASLKTTVAGVPALTALYVTWHDPPMTTGPGTFIDSIITVAGGQNIFSAATGDWPQVSMEEIVRRDPDVVILPVNLGDPSVAWLDKTPGWRDLRAVRTDRVLLVDTDLFSRPGPQVVEAAIQLARLLHPAKFPDESMP